MKSYKARGVVLHTLKYGDSSMVVHLLTDVGGRRSYMVQGVRSTRGRGSKLALFQPMFAVEFEGLESPRRQMDSFREIRSGAVLRSVPFDVRKSTIALFMAEVLYRLVRESEPNGPLFDFVWGSVGALDAMEEGVANFHLWFLANLSRFLGFYPGNAYTAGAFFDIREGLYTKTPPPHAGYMSGEHARTLDDFIRCDVRCLGEIGLNRRQRVGFLDALLVYYGYHLDAIRAVQSVKILQEVF
ncbi:DNA repair protein RecO [Alistipes sp.]|uniref:DNA repair protein RecO n=1 Tax=Alistipes sp. TaxID=1872444 RepID=UPI0025C09695|nr:DNA repair protein RecO [Alistipes sp.]